MERLVNLCFGRFDCTEMRASEMCVTRLQWESVYAGNGFKRAVILEVNGRKVTWEETFGNQLLVNMF